MDWKDYGTGRCCTGGCYHGEPPELSTDVSRFGIRNFEQVIKLMYDGVPVAEAVATVNRLVNQQERRKEWWEA